MKREDAIYKAFSKLMGIKYDNINYVDSFYIHRPEVIKFTNELFDHIESIEAENKELKEKLESIHCNPLNIKLTKENLDLKEKLKDAEWKVELAMAQLEAIEGNKVAEFSGEITVDELSNIIVKDKACLDCVEKDKKTWQRRK